MVRSATGPIDTGSPDCPGLSEKCSATADDKVRTDRAQFRADREVGNAGIETASEHELIAVTEQPIGVRRLQRDARRGRAGGRSIILSQHCTGIEWIGELRSI